MPGAQMLWSVLSGSAAYAASAVYFDGTNDYLSRGAELTGMADGKAGSLSVWLKQGADGTITGILESGTGYFAFERNSSNQYVVDIYNSALTNVLRMNTSAITVAAGWKHILASWDLAASATNLYVTDVTDKTISVGPTNDTIDYTRGDWFVGARSGGTNKLNADIADLWFNPTYIDFSSSANRRKFIDGSGKPVYLGATGNLPTGSAPLIFLSGNVASPFATNKGTGGGFTTTGTLTNTAVGP